MLTPYFKLEQDADFLFLIIKAPHAKITVDSEPEVYIDSNEFKFYAKPYYLRLTFNEELIEDGRESATYESGVFKIKIPKAIEGQEFTDLDMLTKLLAPPTQSTKFAKPPQIEVLSRSSCLGDNFNKIKKVYNKKNMDDKINNCTSEESKINNSSLLEYLPEIERLNIAEENDNIKDNLKDQESDRLDFKDNKKNSEINSNLDKNTRKGFKNESINIIAENIPQCYDNKINNCNEIINKNDNIDLDCSVCNEDNSVNFNSSTANKCNLCNMNNSVSNSCNKCIFNNSISNEWNNDYESEENLEIDWHLDQEINKDEEEENNDFLLQQPKYGFAQLYSGLLKRLQNELYDVIDLKDADNIKKIERRCLRLKDEEKSFNGDHYLADLFQSDGNIEMLIKFVPLWTKNSKEDKFTVQENEILLQLPRKEYLLDPNQRRIALMGLVDILLAYAYNHRTTEGENNVESGWNVNKISATLCWLESFSSLEEVVECFIRRSISYPLYRNCDLSMMIIQDVVQLLSLGKKVVLKCFLEMRGMLMDSDDRYILNNLFINDYCVWIQQLTDQKLLEISNKLEKVEITKKSVGFDLENLENFGKLQLLNSDRDTQDMIDSDDLTDDENESSDDSNNDYSDSNSDPIITCKNNNKNNSLQLSENEDNFNNIEDKDFNIRIA